MRSAIVATFLLVPLLLIEACSDEPAVAPPVVAGDAGEAGAPGEPSTTIDQADSGLATGVLARGGGMVDGRCTCDDEDDTTVDFCPLSARCEYLTFFATALTGLQGRTGGSEVVQVCPRPSVLIGFTAFIDDYDSERPELPQALKRVSIVCGVPKATPTASSVSVEFSELKPAPFEAQGTAYVCERGGVQGFAGGGSSWVEQFVGRCAEATLGSETKDVPKLSLSAVGSITAGVVGKRPFPVTDCPAVAVGLRYQQGDKAIEAIGLVCGDADVTWE